MVTEEVTWASGGIFLCVSTQKVNRGIMEDTHTNRGVRVATDCSHHHRHTLTVRPGGVMRACVSAAGRGRPGKGRIYVQCSKIWWNARRESDTLCQRTALSERTPQKIFEVPHWMSWSYRVNAPNGGVGPMENVLRDSTIHNHLMRVKPVLVLEAEKKNKSGGPDVQPMWDLCRQMCFGFPLIGFQFNSLNSNGPWALMPITFFSYHLCFRSFVGEKVRNRALEKSGGWA